LRSHLGFLAAPLLLGSFSDSVGETKSDSWLESFLRRKPKTDAERRAELVVKVIAAIGCKFFPTAFAEAEANPKRGERCYR
jgi:hypothetical protein